ncbi:MAG: glycoside hydrolase family 3 C-terminal domain-containing protein [Bacteroidetes bacterium]|uniref:Glycoside hydrolase family 3 C-terminal domain-containing protein n=1 Tax=Candidatus Cryptobacteroides faecipullorum TaxID=2840764 RepID=A0A9D9I842_9BACT|nr:glycoside hydrolase family 3 C-terminal domain-containing protein [Candidatus Cryptobacteroides faecipullorum]
MKFMHIVAGFVLAAAPLAAQTPAYLDETRPLEDRIEDALGRMTLEEKIAVIHAQSKFSSPGVARLGIPEIWTTDGPHGIRPEVLWDEWDQAGWTNDSCVAFPALTCLAATWDREMASLYGKCLGEEARYRKKDMVLGPGVNIYRTPLNGRNFEYMGEDPYLSGQMVVPYIKGVQSNGVATCVKHFALNNHETNRHNTNVIVDDRTLYEIYLPAFKAAVQEGGTWAIMGSYNLYKDQHCCHNEYTLNDILRGEWGYDGVVVSDWGGTHDTGQAIRNGLDMEFGSWTDGLKGGSSNAYDNYYLAYPYLEKIRSREVGTEELDNKVRNVLRLMYRTVLDRNRPLGSMCSEAHYAAARKIGGEGIVLLKNEGGLLPMDMDNAGKILVVGENAIKMMTVGGGSSSLKVQREISPLDGIRERAGRNVEVVYERGYVGDVTGEYNGVTTGQDLSESRSAEQLIADAVAQAKDADYVVFVGGLNKSAHQDCEDSDRYGLGLPYGQDKVIEALAEANSNLIVVNVSGNAVAMPWVDKVPAVLQAWFIGSEAGHAIADVLSGDVNPSGKLPFTFPARIEDVPAHIFGEYVGVASRDTVDVEYKDGIYVGYRWTDMQKKTRPLFAFGHGLSYTSFEYGEPELDSTEMTIDSTVTVRVKVTNTGDRAGRETVQMYVGDRKSSLSRPVKELKGFEKVTLAPGESATVSFTVDRDDLSFFDPDRHEWVAEPGKFDIYIAAAADDVRGKVTFELK